VKGMKESLSSGRKPDLTHVRLPFMTYTARPCEYGSVKYERANYLREVDGVRADFERFRAYLRAAASHIFETLDAMEKHQANDPKLLDIAGMKRAAYAVDTDAKPGCPHGPSLLPHVAPACASLMMAVTQATESGLLPRDPGQPWVDGVLAPWSTLRTYDASRITMTFNGVKIEGFADDRDDEVAKHVPASGEYTFTCTLVRADAGSPFVADAGSPFANVVSGTETDDEKALLDAAEARVAMAARARLEDEGHMPEGGGPGGVRW
jgi:hypothetical protein